jgi:hypothetical protein
MGRAPAATGQPTSPSNKPTTVPAALTVGESVFGQPLGWDSTPENVIVTDYGLIVASQKTPLNATSPSELDLVDSVTGRIEAETQLGATTFDDALEAWHDLWVTTSNHGRQSLLRLNPDTLEVTGRWALGGGQSALSDHDLVGAGGALWVAEADRLLRISRTDGAITLSVPLPGANTSDVATNAAGTLLIDGEADDGQGALQRRDPETGALLASHPFLGVVAPIVAGVDGHRIWVAEPTGMQGYVEVLDLTTLAPLSPGACTDGGIGPTCVSGTNGISAILSDRLLWVTQVAGGPERNYCANPLTGQVLGTIQLPNPQQDQVLAIGLQEIYYLAYGATSHLEEEPLPSPCKG